MVYYEIILLLVVLPAVAAGYGMARISERSSGATLRKSSGQVTAAIFGGAIIWFLLAVAARNYAETDGPGWALADWFSHQGKWWVFVVCLSTMFGFIAWDMRKQPASSLISAVIMTALSIGLTVWQTYPIYRILPDTARRDMLGHMRQSHPTTCGPVSLGNLLEQYYGVPSPSERTLARLAGTTRLGTTTRGLQRAARHLGIAFEPARVLHPEEVRALQRPALIAISTIPVVRHSVLLLEGNESGALIIDPDYGLQENADWTWVQRVQYGKTLVVKE